VTTASLAELLRSRQIVQRGDFILASGRRSDYFVNIKRASTDPEVLRAMAEAVAPHVRSERIAGMALGAVPLVVAVALATGRPYVIVRKEPKDHGTQELIEGEVQPGERYVIVEDVATTGGSVLKVAQALRAKGAIVERAIAIVDRAEGAAEALKEAGIELTGLFRPSDLA